MKTPSTIQILRTTIALFLSFTLLCSLGEAETYSYDLLGRLTRVDYDDGTSIDYRYDLNGNRTSLTANAPAPGGGGGGGGGGVDCFIATAAYGSMLDPHVQALRNFREAHLRTNAPGRFLIRVYESTSPPIADVIREHEWLRFIVRLLLTPIVLAAAYPNLALTLVLLFLTWRIHRRRRAITSPAPSGECEARE